LVPDDDSRMREPLAGLVVHNDLVAPRPLLSHRYCHWNRRRLPPIANEQLAGPHRHEHLRFEAIALLYYGCFLSRLAPGPKSEKLAAESRVLLLALDEIFLISRRVNRRIGSATQFRMIAIGQHVHDMQLIPFRFTGAQLVSDEIDEQ